MTQPSLFRSPDPVPYQRGSRTSEQAARALSQSPERRESKAMRLLRAYQEAGTRGLNDSEAHRATGIPRQSLCSLRAMLKARGWIQKAITAGQWDTRLGDEGMRQQVWRVTPAGEARP